MGVQLPVPCLPSSLGLNDAEAAKIEILHSEEVTEAVKNQGVLVGL